MKKIFEFTTTVCIFISICVLAVIAETTEIVSYGTCGENLTWTLYENGYLTINGNGNMDDWHETSRPWMEHRDLITTVEIGNGVTNIGERAFYNCRNLSSIKIGESVTNIGSEAFVYCRSLTNITIPNSVKHIGKRTFYMCITLREITLPFIGCESGRSGTYDSVLGYIFGSRIESEREHEGDDEEKPKPPSGVGTVDKTGNSNGTASLFYDIEIDLSDILVPEPDFFTEQMYSNDKSAEYYIPDSLEKIELTDEKIIPFGAFYNCQNLISVKIPECVERIEQSAFYNCDNLSTVYYEGTETQWENIEICEFNEDLFNAEIIFVGVSHEAKNGDTNNDGKINVQDVILLAQYCAGWESAKDIIEIYSSDCNGDGITNIRDVILLAQYCAGWEVNLNN